MVGTMDTINLIVPIFSGFDIMLKDKMYFNAVQENLCRQYLKLEIEVEKMVTYFMVQKQPRHYFSPKKGSSDYMEALNPQEMSFSGIAYSLQDKEQLMVWLQTFFGKF